MLRELLKKKEFLKIIKETLKRKEILDVILIGSLVKGKENPKDIDLIVLYNERPDSETEHKVRNQLEKVIKNVEVINKTYDGLFKPEFFAKESVLAEGFSLKGKKFISEGLGYSNLILYKYSLRDLNKSKRMQFYYSLYGRDKKGGILEKNKCYKFSDTIILAPIESSDMIKNFLESWKVKYVGFPILIPKRIKNHILKK